MASSDAPVYVFHQDSRIVLPYYFTFRVFAKERWIGQEILTVFEQEFVDRSPEYYRRAIVDGAIKINALPCLPSTRICSGDLITHRLHRHEPSVLNVAIEIIETKPGWIVVDKPATIPVHATGRYLYNSVIGILQSEHGFSHLSAINRLDRLVSGVLVLAQTKQAAARLHQQMRTGLVSKEYVALVRGLFPHDKLVCRSPLMVSDKKRGISRVCIGGKPCETTFVRIAATSTMSLVKCMPATGRSHQIRVHLQSLNHPILNDPLYNPSDPELPRLSILHPLLEVDVPEWFDPNCDECQKQRIRSSNHPHISIHVPITQDNQTPIYLHAHKYSIDGESFQIPWPSWTEQIGREQVIA